MLACSDGLWNYAPTDAAMGELATMLPEAGEPVPFADVCERLVTWAVGAGGMDNICVALRAQRRKQRRDDHRMRAARRSRPKPTRTSSCRRAPMSWTRWSPWPRRRPQRRRVGPGDVQDRAEIVVVDCSGSMGSSRKMEAAKAAASAAVDVIDDGVRSPSSPATTRPSCCGLRTAGPSAPPAGRSDAAKNAIAQLQAAGGTAIGTWLDLARRLFSNTGAAARHAILLTDGRNEHQQPMS